MIKNLGKFKEKKENNKLSDDANRYAWFSSWE
jgi:hypothetical protein